MATADATISIAPPPSADAYGDLIKATTGLAGYWRLDEASGTTAADSSGGGRPGTYSGGVVQNQPGIPAGGAAASFDGVDDVVTALSPLNVGYSITLEAWVYIGPGTHKGCFLKVGETPPGDGSEHAGLSMGVGSGSFDTPGSNLILLHDRLRWLPTSAVLTEGWHHVVFQSDDSAVPRASLDGVEVFTAGAGLPAAPSDTTSQVSIGGYVDRTDIRYFAGAIDEVAVYGVTLSPAQILEHYNAGLTPPPAGPTYKNLSGSSAGTSTATATPARRRSLVAAAAGVAATVATPTRRRALTASSVGAATTTATPTRKRRLVAVSAGLASVAVALTRRRALSATSAGSAITVAVIDKAGSLFRNLLGSSAGRATTTATPTRRRRLLGTATGVAGASGTLSKGTPVPTTGVVWNGSTFQVGGVGTAVLWGSDAFQASGAFPSVTWETDHFEAEVTA